MHGRKLSIVAAALANTLGGGVFAMSTMTDDELAVALARSAVERAAPEELVIFPAASEAFLEGDDPSKKTRGDPMLGFGVESAVILLSPVALTVAKDVLGFLRDQLKKQADEHGDEAFDWLVKKLLRRGDDKKDEAPRRDRRAGTRRSSRTSSSTRCASSRSRRRSSSSCRRTRRSSSPTRSSAASRRRERGAQPRPLPHSCGRDSTRSSSRRTRRSGSPCSLLAVLGANLYVWNWLWIAYGIEQERTIATGYLECETIRPALELLGINDGLPTPGRSKRRSRGLCHGRQQCRWPSG